ncbi:UDP-glucoronosyl and UDP-glucosyl transferase [Oesophagostomum dentatum]|uniref:glucuronosyltransferase n=1 Tax=Oesophagostomum dentatum TaxID=61180 RepID=A0A0B1TM55_OESDE|nr:UDP-glucoronosyl and UDP-glucosyl transferase [Oesophagostomum dentatum]
MRHRSYSFSILAIIVSSKICYDLSNRTETSGSHSTPYLIMHWRFVIILISLAICNAYKFLVYSPIFGYSHTKFTGSIADALTEAGHNVTILMAVLDKEQEKLSDPALTKQIFKVGPDPRTAEIIRYKGSKMSKIWEMQPTPYQLLQNINPNLTAQFAFQCEKVFSDEGLMEKLRAMKFDAGIAETFTICGFGELAVEGEQMNIFGRMKNTMDVYFSSKYFENMYKKEINAFQAKFGKSFKGYNELLVEASYMLTNSIPYLDFPRPLLHKTVPIGGIAVQANHTKQPLEEKWDEILNERKTTVLISFGTIAKAQYMPDKYKYVFMLFQLAKLKSNAEYVRKGLLEVVRSMPETTFLWKYEGSETNFGSDLPNLHISSWFPQNALISDRRLTVFVTHAGLASVNEAAFFGKPTILVPIFADQTRNALMLAKHGGGIVMKKTDLEYPHILRGNLQRILNDQSYAQKAKRLSEMLLNLPISPKDLVVKHCEFAARFGRLPNLDPYGRQLSIIHYYLIDVFFAGAAVLVAVLFVFVILLRKCCCSIKKSKMD